jgi:uncharacterized protein YyaL (SSP411 family)
MNENKPKHSNLLIHESSPYLLQHAHNPVNWRPWNDESLALAKKENKIMIISIGYSACHWCHVMEHESFEDETVAAIMNDHFICIKIDREERPDIDQVYMMAVQLMTGHGGWPLNCFALPDGRPVYGGTYFQKQQWINVLLNIADLYKNEPEKVFKYAEQLTEGIRLSELVKISTDEPVFSSEVLVRSYNDWKPRFDNKFGGPDKAPKFPLPNNYQYLLRLAHSGVLPEAERNSLKKHVQLTLKKMFYGGIYDQVGGGFARYSVDAYWKVPHFEKMLYDNAQLVSLYSEAWTAFQDPLYKDVVYETLAFVSRELDQAQGGFYSALDADSEGVEGKFYVWSMEEIKETAGADFAIAADYFNINEAGLWEDENYIPLREKDDSEIASKHGISVEELRTKVGLLKKALLEKREKRVRPGLDNKVLCSWNALMIKAFADAYTAFSDPAFLRTATGKMRYLRSSCMQSDNRLLRLAGNSNINGFLEDYSFFVEALLSLYDATLNEEYLHEAKSLVEYCKKHFYEKSSSMFYFSSDLDPALISRKTELPDNVIPSSNSSLARSLFYLGHLLEIPEYIEQSRTMLNHMKDDLIAYGPGYSNWAMLMMHFTEPFFEIAIVGKAVDEKRAELKKHYLPNVIFAGSSGKSTMPLLRDRLTEAETMIYVCRETSCMKPETEIAAALKHLHTD